MPIDVKEADGHRIFGMILAYIRGKATIKQTIAAIEIGSSSPSEITTILNEVIAGTATSLDERLKRAATLRGELMSRGLLT